MAIANELSSDVAAAILATKDNEAHADSKDLIEIVRNFHSALRPLTAEERRRRLHSQSSEAPPRSNSQAATGSR